MKTIDSLTLKYFELENKPFIEGAVVQKIQLPSRSEIILNLRNLSKSNSQNKKLYININPSYPHICFINDVSLAKRDINIPKSPPMFCMQLRKYLNGSKIKTFQVVKYERIIEFYFDYFDEIGSLSRLCLCVELMGKHSNIILYNLADKKIIGSIHNISKDKSSIREIYGGAKYIYPPLKEKLDILNCSYATFSNIAHDCDKDKISNSFYYFSKGILQEIFNLNLSTEKTFEFMCNLQSGKEKDFIINYFSKASSVTDSIDNYFSDILFENILSQKKNKLIKSFEKDYKKLQKTLNFSNESNKTEKIKALADYIQANLYNIKKGDKFFLFEGEKFELEQNLTPVQNAQKYYNKYKKLKTAKEIELKRRKEACEKSDYLNSIIFNIENACDFSDLQGSKEELIKLGYINEQISNKQDKTSLNITKTQFRGFDIYIGKNNKQNDYLISKIARGEDLWFHGQNFPSSHVVLRLPNNKKSPSKEVIEFCAKLTKENSKAKLSGKTPIIMTKIKYLKKPPNTYLGYVTYKNETEIIIDD